MPRYSARLLKENAAVTAANAKLLSGELRGLHETSLLNDFGVTEHPVQRAYRFPVSVSAPIPISDADTWVGFYDSNVDLVRNPVFEDSFERYYWTGDSYVHSGVPQYNTRARINAGWTADPPYILGIPTPTNQIAIAPPSGLAETRAYLYTFVSEYGEEGPPCAPTLATGQNGTWVLSNFDTPTSNPTVLGSTSYNIPTLRIYRTVTGQQSDSYFHVADITSGTTSYNDTVDDTTVANNFTLPSTTWTGPPATLQGLTAHPGGFLVGFSGRDLWLSEPYQPHAWPVQYVQTCQTEIVGVQIYTNVIVVTTTSHPYVAEGMAPLNMTLQKIDSFDPCVSRRSMVTTMNGVYYASPQGIVNSQAGEDSLVTYNLFTREEWQDLFSPTTVYAVGYGVEYIAFDTASTGFIFSPVDPNTPMVTLDRFSGVTAIQNDPYTGDVYLVQNNQVRLWDPPTTIPYEYTWQSKQFDLPKPVNMGAFRLKFNGGSFNLSPEELSDYTTFNDWMIVKTNSGPAGLNAINSQQINGTRQYTVPGYPAFQNRIPIGGSQLFDIGLFEDIDAAVQVNIYYRDLDSNWDKAFSWLVVDERIYRMPTGYKSDGWYIELIGNTNVYSFAMAETAKELQKV